MKTGYAQPMPVNNEYLVRERDRRRVRELAAVLLLAVLTLTPLLAYTWLQLELRQIGASIKGHERDLIDLGKQERRLRLEVGRQESPSVLTRRAEQELELMAPRLEQVVFLEVEGEP
jgi:hypothetical protein